MSESNRTEPATPKRRQELRERGEVAKSRDLVGALVLLACLGALALAGEGLAANLGAGLRSALAAMGEVRTGDAFAGLEVPLWSAAKAMAPVLGAALLMSVAGNLGQTGLLFARKALSLDLGRLFSMGKLKQLFSGQALFEVAKSLVKLGLVAAVVHQVLSRELDAVVGLRERPPPEIAAGIAAMCLRVAGWGGMALLAIGALDYGFQRWRMEVAMRMTKDEVKEELKRQEGDPLIKMRVRSKQREIARQRMIQAVKTADVVLTNPTHYAVALLYRPGEMGAPRVVAKGRGPIAARIREVARENGVPVVENRPLARALYRAVKVGREVPVALYKAVAEVLAYVYTRRRAAGLGGRT